jgi:hypothetical protein
MKGTTTAIKKLLILESLEGQGNRRGVLHAPHCSPRDTLIADPQINLINNSHCAIPRNLLEYAHGVVLRFSWFFLQIQNFS